jgi:2,3-bisphosphoglycerate-dependent phosphoglycerate mutase
MEQTALEPYYKKYGKEKVDKALDYLLYKNPSALPKNEEATKPILYVFRHGESEDNKNLLHSGWREAQLTETGMLQALKIAPLIKNKKIDMLISSPQVRAFDTMKIAVCLNDKARALKIETDSRLKERSYGILQGLSKLEEYLEDPALSDKIRRDYNYKVENGESIKEVVERVKLFCDEILPLMKEHKINIAVSCHGNSIRGFRKYFEPQLTQEEISHLETPLGQDYMAYAIS